jgi:CHAT domain-containing protein/tetratricopeptide (TPR) repeat protein
MHLKLPTCGKSQSSAHHRSLLLFITLILLGGTVAAQETKESQEQAATKSMLEGMQLVAEGSPASLTKAIEKFESARIAMHSLKIPLGEGLMLSLIGHAYSMLDQNEKAKEKFLESLPLFRDAHAPPQAEGASLIRLGMIHSSLGEMEQALDRFKQAAKLFHDAGDTDGEALTLSLLGTVHIFLGRPEETLAYYTKADELYRATSSREKAPVMMDLLAPLMGEPGNPDKARETLERSLSLTRAARIPRVEAMALLTLGFYYNYKSNLPKARELYEQALPIFHKENDRFAESAVLLGLCTTELAARDYEKGIGYCNRAQALQHANGDRQAEALTLKQIALAERGRGNLAASQTAIESAIANRESVRTKVVSPAYRLSYSAGSQDYYEFYIDLLMRLHKQHAGDGYDGRALQASERARARSLLETLNEANADIRQGIDPVLLQRERETQRRLNAAAQAQIELQSRAHSEEQTRAAAAEIEQLIKDLQQVETEIRKTSPRYAALMQPEPLMLKEIQTQVLDPDTLLLEYSLGDEKSYLWAVTSTSINSYELAPADEIENATRDFYNLLNARNAPVKDETNDQREIRIARADSAIPAAAVALSGLVIAPVADQLGKKRLAIVADGALHFIPFGALPSVSPAASGNGRQRIAGKPKLLIADHEIVNLPSASTLAVIRGDTAGRQKAARSVAVLADPVFMPDDERVKTRDKGPTNTDNSTTSRRESTLERQLIKATEDTGVAQGPFYVPRLPGTRREAEQIVAMVSSVDRRLALDFAANRETAMSAELGQYRYVHLSTHGLLNSVHPELSGLVFSLVNERGEPKDGFLLAHEIFNLKIPAEAVVLSACETGIGKDIRGEGLVSLTRGFMYAGAPRVVVSLWAVSDPATTELMVRFYEGILKQGLRPAAALRAAQLSLMNEKRWGSPYYWAPFTLQGEWR